MKMLFNLLILPILFFGSFACSGDDNDPGVQIRIENDTNYNFEEVVLAFWEYGSSDKITFTAVAANSTTSYTSWPHVDDAGVQVKFLNNSGNIVTLSTGNPFVTRDEQTSGSYTYRIYDIDEEEGIVYWERT